MTCAALKYSNQTDVTREAVAKRIIDLARDGELDPDWLCEQALADLRSPPPSV
jgi:hypothetical protein